METRSELGVDKLFYEMAIEQNELYIKSYENLRNKAGNLIGFIGVILNLEILATVQLTSNNIQTPYILFLVCSSFILFVSLLFAMDAFKSSRVPLIDVDKLIDEFYDKTEEETLQGISATIGNNITKNRKQLFKENNLLNYSLILLVIALFFVLLFFFSYSIILLS